MLSLFNKCAILSERVAAVFQLKPSWVAADVRVSVGPWKVLFFLTLHRNDVWLVLFTF